MPSEGQLTGEGRVTSEGRELCNSELAERAADARRGLAPPPAQVRRLGWTLLASTPGLFILRGVCAVMVRRLEVERGAPTLESRRGIIRLWRIEHYSEAAPERGEPWLLDDGALLHAADPVLELHIRSDRLLSALAAGAPWKPVVADEFRSLVPLLLARDEIAIVGSTILRRQAIAFGASVRDVPPGLHSSFDSFYRKLILLAFHPGGARRVLRERQTLADAAISRECFCARFG